MVYLSNFLQKSTENIEKNTILHYNKLIKQKGYEMAVSSEKFLNQFYMQMRFNEMCTMYPEKLKTFKKYLKNGDYKFRGDMDMWEKRLWDAAKGTGNELPDGQNGQWAMDDDAWKDLYLEFRNALRNMQLRKSEFDDPDKDSYNRPAIGFLNDYFGKDKIFSFATASDEAEKEIEKFAECLKDRDVQNILDAAFSKMWGMTDTTCQKLLTDIEPGKKYNSDPEFQTKLLNVINAIKSASHSYYEDERNMFEALKKELDDKGLKMGNYQTILDGFDDEIDDGKLTAFKAKYKELLKDVGTNKKLQKQFQSQKITAALENAEKKVSYENKDSENFLEDSKNDKKTLWQEIKDWSKDTYEDVFEKYMSLRADRLYFSPQAKDIVGALNKKTKPTDGLDGILKAAGDAKSDLQKKSMSATKYFDWMTKTLEEIKKTKPKAFEGALRNGIQLNAVVEELIRRAVRDSENGDKHAIEAARAALEVISVSKYGLTTSKIMDSLKKEWENFSFLSDSELSWNKNEYTRMLTQAMDKSLVFVMKGIGYGATALINTINKTGSKFNGNRRGLSDASKKWEEDNEERKNAMIRKRDEDDLNDNLEIVDQQDVINGTGITDLDAEKQILKSQQTDVKNKKKALRKAERDLADAKMEYNKYVEEYNKAVDKYKQEKTNGKNKIDQKQDEVNQANTNVSAKQDEKQKLENIINDYNNMPAENKQRRAEIDKKRNELYQIKNTLQKISIPYKNAAQEARAQLLQQRYIQKKDELKNDIKKWREQEQKYNTRNTPGSEYMDAVNAIPNANMEITAAQNALTAAQTELSTTTTAVQNAINSAKNDKDTLAPDTQKAIQAYNKAKQAYDKAFADYKDAQNMSADTASKIKQFEEATKRIEELNKSISERNETVNKWDEKHKNQYDDLIAYWDLLETGRDGRVGPFYNFFTLSKKKAQEKLNNNKNTIIQNYRNDYVFA